MTRQPCKQNDPRVCHGCHRFAGDRQAMIDGRLRWFCPACPTPSEIIERRNKIRDSWSAHERWVRAGRVVRPVEVELVRITTGDRSSSYSE